MAGTRGAASGRQLQTEQVAIADLRLDPRNARQHPARNLDTITKSLERFGQQRPIMVSADNVVMAGNGVLLAARELGWSTIAVVRSDLIGADLSAYSVVDNRAGELSTWEPVSLDALLSELQNQDESLLGIVGFSVEELANILHPLDAEGFAGGPQYQVRGEAIVIELPRDVDHQQVKEEVRAMCDAHQLSYKVLQGKR